MTTGKHINAEFDAELGSLKSQILAMGNWSIGTSVRPSPP